MAKQAEQVFINDLGTIQGILLVQSIAGFGFRAPIYQAAMRQEIDLAETTPGGEVAIEAFKPGRPVLAVLGDDGPAPAGPEGFAQTDQLLRWAGVAILYSAGGEERLYQDAVKLTRRYGRCLLIETDSAQRKAWLDAIEAEMFDRHEDGIKQLVGVDFRAPGDEPHYREAPV